MIGSYLRVPRGYGKLFDDAEANGSTYISKDSSASGSAKLRNCELRDGSSASDRVQVYGGRFLNSHIKGDTIVAGTPHVMDSTLWCSEVSGSPQLGHVYAYGNTEICDSPKLFGAYDAPLKLCNAIIYGSPEVYGSFEITGRVHEGTWTRAPRHFKLQWCQLSECVIKNGEQHVLLDCRCRSLSYWAKHGPKLAKRWLWSDDMISVTLDTIVREFPVAPKL